MESIKKLFTSIHLFEDAYITLNGGTLQLCKMIFDVIFDKWLWWLIVIFFQILNYTNAKKATIVSEDNDGVLYYQGETTFTDSFSSIINHIQNKRNALNQNTIYQHLMSCSSAECRSAISDANFFSLVSNFSDSSGLENGIYLCKGTKIWQIKTNGQCQCRSIYDHTESVMSFSATPNGLVWFNSDKDSVTSITNFTGSVQPTNISLTSNHPVLSLLCNTPAPAKHTPTVISNDGSEVLLNVSLVVFSASEPSLLQCAGIVQNNSNTVYSFLYGYVSEEPCLNSSDCTEQVVDEIGSVSTVKLQNLQPNSSYQIQLTLSKRHEATYQVFSPVFKLATSCGVSSPVQNIVCNSLSFSLIEILWDVPSHKNSASINYQLRSEGDILLENTDVFRFRFNSTLRNFEIRAYAVDCPSAEGLFSSANMTCGPFVKPNLRVSSTTSDSITLSWPPLENVKNIVISWSQISLNPLLWTDSYPLPGTAVEDTITDLLPSTGYALRGNFTYVNGFYYVTSEKRLKTMDGPPDAPSNVKIIDNTSPNKLAWSRPVSSDNLRNFSIEARNRSAPDSAHIKYGLWHVIRNISALREGTSWDISNLINLEWYEFRVYATNDFGRGDASLRTGPYQYALPIDNSRIRWIVIGSSTGGSVFIIVAVAAYACWRCRKRRRRKLAKKSLPPEITTVHINYGMDIELARIRHMTNLAIAAGNQGGQLNLPSDYRARLNLFPRDQLKLGQLLGSGAFGEVYRGVAMNIHGGDSGEARVAVKILKDSASEIEKCEFLMEAYFMSLFDHSNIISLLGVCLDNEPQFIILELMEGGDLLKYLREACPTKDFTAKLSMIDLLNIILDLAAGCQYLESQHFIHRDLAARNCLVSTKAFKTDFRVVKIGDFGLARDIYRNDYYHKEGEGLVPVRWMALESIMLKRYTVQSDVWAFGVLMWEVMTFGQQPYPAYTNLEVIHFVQDGGRLGQPIGCPDVMYTLMRECWNVSPSERPTFQEVLEMLQDCKAEIPYLNTDSIKWTRNGQINYSAVSIPATRDSVFDETSPNGILNHGFVPDEVFPYSPISEALSNLESTSPVSSPSSPYANVEVSHTSDVSTGESESEEIPQRHMNYAHIGFAPSRETSVKNVAVELSTNGNKHRENEASAQPDETIPLKTYSSSGSSRVKKNEYVKSPLNPLQLSVFRPPVNNRNADNNASHSQHERQQTATPSKRRRPKRNNIARSNYENNLNDSGKDSGSSSYVNERQRMDSSSNSDFSPEHKNVAYI
ncbi:proto-oncogene tyrosine-protein kinase ROS-like isoform X2 [Clavelina lepadiformis]|uniref:proto-oncogene tyrosine-protein kinase ROS-like isoform X2 n=1 Tax=Clavelina lepadiformis TaxID=159417 RepID=UPI0040436027